MYLKRTTNFGHSWSWTKAILVLLSLVLVLIPWEVLDSARDYPWVKYLIFSALASAIFSIPVDDLALDGKYFYYLRTSLLPFFRQVHRYEISRIKSLRAAGDGSSRGNRNTIEIEFIDHSRVHLEVSIYRRELMDMLLAVRDLMTAEDRRQSLMAG